MAVWFVTGTTRGFGRELVEALLRDGEQVVAGVRNSHSAPQSPDGSGQLLTVPLDVTDSRAAEAAVEAALDRFGRIDVVVNNAGRGLVGAVEETSDAQAREVFDVNVFGLLNVVRAALPALRRQRSGTVVNVSSLAGFSGSLAWGVYAGSKFAVEGISESLRKELDPLGVRVLLVQPGVFRTEFLSEESLLHAQHTIDDYADTAGKARTAVPSNRGAQRGDPRKAARVIVDAVRSDDAPSRIQLGEDAVRVVRAKLDLVSEELSRWTPRAVTTDFDPEERDTPAAAPAPQGPTG